MRYHSFALALLIRLRERGAMTEQDVRAWCRRGIACPLVPAYLQRMVDAGAITFDGERYERAPA